MGNSPASQRPLIGVTVEVLEPPAYEGQRRYQLFTDYLESCLRQAGGIGLLIPGDTPVNDVDSVLKVLDGILLTGGDDIDLQPLGGPSPPKTSKPIPLAQQTFSIALAEAAREQRIPTLGICLGMQIMGVESGAPLIQHLEESDKHQAGIEHRVNAVSGTKLASLLGEEPVEIKSFHHQALKHPGETLQAAAWSEDGVLEGVENPDHPFAIGVQWHPERTPNSIPTQKIFSSFVSAARNYREGR